MHSSHFLKFSKVSGAGNKFLKDELSETATLTLPLKGKTDLFVSANLMNIFYREVNLYLDKALYQCILSHRLIADGNFSWGAVTQYYSSFFAISGLIRLHEVAFVRICSNDYEIRHDTSTVYKILGLNTKGLHRLVWKTYYDLYKNFTHENDIFLYIVKPYMEDTYFDTNRRNDINYAPGKGYDELYQTPATINRLKKERTSDFYSSKEFNKGNEWTDTTALTQHRIRFLANLVCKIDSHSDHPAQAKERTNNREKLIQKYEINIKYSKRYISWLKGE